MRPQTLLPEENGAGLRYCAKDRPGSCAYHSRQEFVMDEEFRLTPERVLDLLHLGARAAPSKAFQKRGIALPAKAGA
jgi:hypothetical protein